MTYNSGVSWNEGTWDIRRLAAGRRGNKGRALYITNGKKQSKQYYRNVLQEHSNIPLVGRTIMEQHKGH